MKGSNYHTGTSIANQRISNSFFVLLNNEFSNKELKNSPRLKTPGDFAKQLNIHVNHLNRVLKQTAQKTTSQLIKEKVLKEAKYLLKEKHWNIAEIAYALGFKEATHFSNFFKKHARITPQGFRKCLNVVCYCLMDVCF
ncbi:AraC family transcriptional regulator [Galbibacter sp. PAP.153]|uniref:helix-turn-helix domain-containing protein n=1 Tax=Galbibacter sp. PAP.153 TaxID=3104623 RepID=UPI00300B98A7